MNTIRSAFYARVSSEQQAVAHTIESQLAALSERARTDGTPVPPARQFVDDGYSGSTLVRTALDRLRDLAAVGAVDRIYVHSPDRLARNYAYPVLLVDEWQRAGVELVFLNRPLGRSPEDDLLLQVQGIVAEYERAKIMERSRRGKKHAAQSGSLNVMSNTPYGYRYVTVHDGGCHARFEPAPEQAHVVQQIFSWIGPDRCSLSEVCHRLPRAGQSTASGRRIWSRQAVWHILQNPAYQGQAAYGKTRMMPRTRKTRLRPPRGRPAEPRRSNSPVATDQKEWLFVPAAALVDAALFRAVQNQLRENRRRARLGRREFLETAIWREVRDLLTNPRRLEQQYQKGSGLGTSLQEVENLRVQRHKLQQGLERIIDSFAEGLIDKEQFASRMTRAKNRIAELGAKINVDTGDADQQERLRFLASRLQELAATVG